MDTITRKQARENGLYRYFTGKPCVHGHIAERTVSGKNCIECSRISGRQTKKRWRAENPDLHKDRIRAWAKANPEKKRAGQAKCKARKPEKYRQIARSASARWKATHPGAASEASKRWQARNPEKRAAYGRNRRARERNAEGAHTAEDIFAIVSAQKHRCAWCRADLRKVRRHVDHVVPLALGGSNGRENLQLLCQPCNQRKHDTHPIVFAQREGRLL